MIERKDGQGFLEILPARDVDGLHGKTYLFLGVDELHTQRNYRVLEALELDRTRPDAMQWFSSYASPSRQAGTPLNDLLRQHEAKTDPRLYVSWYSGTVEQANPSLNQPLGPTIADIEDAQRSLPSWIFRRLYLNLGGQPDSAAYSVDDVEASTIRGRTVLPPVLGVTYRAFCDMSGGGPDDATLAIGHRTPDGKAVVDLVIDQGPRTVGKSFNVHQATARFASVLLQYNQLSSVTGDNFAKRWPVEAFKLCGVTYTVARLSKAELYAALEPKLTSGLVELLDDPKLFEQLIGLVRKGDRITDAGAHDDRANSVAGLVHLLLGVNEQPWFFRSGGITIGSTAPPPRTPFEEFVWRQPFHCYWPPDGHLPPRERPDDPFGDELREAIERELFGGPR